MKKVIPNLIRGQVVKRLVKAIPVIKIKSIVEAVPKLGAAAKRVKFSYIPISVEPVCNLKKVISFDSAASREDASYAGALGINTGKAALHDPGLG